MFFYNLRHFWGFFKDAQPDGVVFHMSGVDGDRLAVRDRPENCPAEILVDPDSYFWDVAEGDCPKPCAKLMTYDWLVDPDEPVWPPQLEDAALSTAIGGAIRTQVTAGATSIILPSPLITSPDQLNTAIQWLELGLAVPESDQAPCLAMVAVSDDILPEIADSLVDQLTALDGIVGAYVCIDTTGSTAVQMTDEATEAALLEMVYLLAEINGMKVIVNYADILGLACLGLGAAAFVSGYENKARQLDFTDFSGDGGRSLPKFTSLECCIRLRPERDLKRIAQKRRLLRVFERDVTTSSDQLFAALRAQADVLPPEWRETPNNVSAARTHVIELLSGHAADIVRAGNVQARAQYVLDWLIESERTVSYLNERFAESPLDEDGRWVTGWRRAFESICDRYELG